MRGAFGAILWFSWIGVVIAAVPTGIWVFTDTYCATSKRIMGAFAAAGLVGGVIGESAAVGSLFLAIEWACRRGEQVCHDGQTGMLLIFTIPIFSLMGAVISPVWTRLSCGFASDRILAPVFIYKGPKRWTNWMTRLGIQIALWSTLLGVITLLSIRGF